MTLLFPLIVLSDEIFSLPLSAEETYMSLGVESRLLPGADDAKSSVRLMGETPPPNDVDGSSFLKSGRFLYSSFFCS
jgi:hypothetical protein